MRIAYLLLHDFSFARLPISEFVHRWFHFSKEYARRMSALGHQVTLYTLADDLRTSVHYELDGFTIKAFPVSFRFPPMLKFGNAQNPLVLRELSADRPDIIHFHTHQLWSYPYYAIWARAKGIPLVAQYHGRVDPFMRIKGRVFSSAYKMADAYLAPTEEDRRELVEDAGVATGRVLKFPNTGVDTELFRLRGPKSEVPSMLYVGRIPDLPSNLWEKSPERLLFILYRMRKAGLPVKLTVVGDGPGLSHMQEATRKLGLGDLVRFTGYLPQSDLPRFYAESWFTFDPMYMTDIDPYWGGTLKESLSCGTPVVAFNDRRSGEREFGYLVRCDPAEAAVVLEAALTTPDDLIAMGRRGRDFVTRHADWNVVTERSMKVYNWCIA